VTARVLDITKKDGIVDLTFREEMLVGDDSAKSSKKKVRISVPKLAHNTLALICFEVLVPLEGNSLFFKKERSKDLSRGSKLGGVHCTSPQRVVTVIMKHIVPSNSECRDVRIFSALSEFPRAGERCL